MNILLYKKCVATHIEDLYFVYFFSWLLSTRVLTLRFLFETLVIQNDVTQFWLIFWQPLFYIKSSISVIITTPLTPSPLKQWRHSLMTKSIFYIRGGQLFLARGPHWKQNWSLRVSIIWTYSIWRFREESAFSCPFSKRKRFKRHINQPKKYSRAT